MVPSKSEYGTIASAASVVATAKDEEDEAKNLVKEKEILMNYMKEKGYYEEVSSLNEIRKGRSIFQRVVKIRPPLLPPPTTTSSSSLNEQQPNDDARKNREDRISGNDNDSKNKNRIDKIVHEWKSGWENMRKTKQQQQNVTKTTKQGNNLIIKKTQQQNEENDEPCFGNQQDNDNSKARKSRQNTPSSMLTSFRVDGHHLSPPPIKEILYQEDQMNNKLKKKKNMRSSTMTKSPIVAKLLFVNGSFSTSNQFDLLLQAMCQRVVQSVGEESTQAQQQGAKTPSGEDTCEATSLNKEGGGGEDGRENDDRKNISKGRNTSLLLSRSSRADNDTTTNDDDDYDCNSRKPGGIECHLYDSFGCGKSSHSASDWDTYCEKALLKDLEEITNQIMTFTNKRDKFVHFVNDGSIRTNSKIVNRISTSAIFNNDDDDEDKLIDKFNNNISIVKTKKCRQKQNDQCLPIFLIGHAYGTSQIIRLINNMSPSQCNQIKGIVLISSALSDGPVDRLHSGINCTPMSSCMWTLPDFILKMIHPNRKCDNFVEMSRDGGGVGTESEGEELDNNNKSIRMMKAFYRQNHWASTYDASKVMTTTNNLKVCMIHGRDDSIIPISGGLHLYDKLSSSSSLSSSLSDKSGIGSCGDSVCQITSGGSSARSSDKKKKKRKGKEFFAVRDSSHYVFVDKPEVVSGIILDFVSSCLP